MERIYKTPLYRKFLTPLFSLISDIQWERPKEIVTGRRFNITEADKEVLLLEFSKRLHIVATRKNSHLTTFFIALGDWLKRPRWGWGHYSHIIVQTKFGPRKEDLEFIHAVKGGVMKATFDEVVKCDSIALMIGENYSEAEWKEYSPKMSAEAHENLDKPYDNALNSQEQTHMSCVEVGRDSVRQLPGYDDRFFGFEYFIWKVRNLTPQMFYDCADFRKNLEIRR